MRVSSLSLQYVLIEVEGQRNGSPLDLTTFDIQVAFVPDDDSDHDPDEDAWGNADWEIHGTVYFARALVGPLGDYELDKGHYRPFVRFLNATPENPVLRASERLTIF